MRVRKAKGDTFTYYRATSQAGSGFATEETHVIMSCRDEILRCAGEVLKGTVTNEFTIREIIDCMAKKGTTYKHSTIRTHITSRMCEGAPDHHHVTYQDLERTHRGTYRLTGRPGESGPSRSVIEERRTALSPKRRGLTRDPILFIDPNKLSSTFRGYVRNLPSASIVASELTSFESWFRVELGVVLLRLGINRKHLRYNYNYPMKEYKRQKADICVDVVKPIVFELKTFASGADANKLANFPRQNLMLQEHVKAGLFLQGISFATFNGYPDTKLQVLITRLFPDSTNWDISGPHKMLDEYPLVFVVASTMLQEAEQGR